MEIMCNSRILQPGELQCSPLQLPMAQAPKLCLVPHKNGTDFTSESKGWAIRGQRGQLDMGYGYDHRCGASTATAGRQSPSPASFSRQPPFLPPGLRVWPWDLDTSDEVGAELEGAAPAL